ncbi:MAG: hypothetical protein FJ033_03595 [Chloroflexi bacterium]|nr:hypothetical protein [Chloroflexota bacterium]
MSISRHVIIGLALVAMVLAGWARGDRIEISEFKRDEAQMVLLARDVIALRALPVRGIETSVPGLANGPLAIYLTAIPTALSPDPTLATGFVAIVNLLAVALAARVAWLIFGTEAALATAILYGAGSWATIFSRKIWANEYMPLFVSLACLGFVQFVRSGHQTWLLVGWVSLAALPNLHPSGFSFLPVGLVPFICRPQALRKPATYVSIALAAATVLPYALIELARDGGIRALMASSNWGTASVWPALRLAGNLIGASGYVTHAPPTSEELVGLPSTREADVILVALCLVGVLLSLRRAVAPGPSGSRAEPFVFAAFVAIPLGLAAVSGRATVIHYLIPTLPILFIAVGAGAGTIAGGYGNWPITRHIARVVALLLCLSLVGVQVVHRERYLGAVGERGGALDFGVPLLFQQGAVQLAQTYGAPDTLLINGAGRHGLDDLPWIWRALWPSAGRVLSAGITTALPLPLGRTIVVVGPATSAAMRFELARVGDKLDETDPFPGIDGHYEYWQIVATDYRRVAPVAKFADGFDLLGHNVETGMTGRLKIITVWRARERISGLYSMFFHLRDAGGRPLAGVDPYDVVGDDLRQGDGLLVWAEFDVPPGLDPASLGLSLGIYRPATGDRLSTLDASDRSLVDSFAIGTLPLD